MAIVRRIDNLGRVVLPLEMRRSLGLEKEDPVEIQVMEDTIFIRKFRPVCRLCGRAVKVDGAMIQDNYVCGRCRKKLALE